LNFSSGYRMKLLETRQQKIINLSGAMEETVNNRDQTMDRAAYLFEQIKPELLKLLKNAPEYGACGIDVTIHQGEVIRLAVRAEVTRKIPATKITGETETKGRLITNV